MFYSNELLSKRDSGFGLLWLAATLGSKSTLKKLTKKSVLTADISLLCKQIGQPSEPLALRLSSNLMVGVARVYKLKHEIFVTDVTTVYSTLKNTDLGSNNNVRVVDPKSLQMKRSTAAFDKITMMVDHENFLDLGLDSFGFDWDVQINDVDSIVDGSRRSRSLEANRARHTMDESHLQSSSLDDAFDPFDYFDVGNVAGESSALIDLGLDLGLDWDAGPQPGLDVDFNMEDIEMGDGPGFDVPDYQPMDDGLDFPLKSGADTNEALVARSDAWRSRSPSAQKRGRTEDQEDEFASAGATPRSILRARPLSDIGNVLQEQNSFQEGDFVLPDSDPNALGGSVNGLLDNEDRATTPKPRRMKKQVRILLDARTELTDKELKDARDNYLTEQARLRVEIDEQRFNKDAAERVQDLMRAPPAIFQAEALRELWAATFLAQIETKTGAITLVAEPRKRARKRRRVEDSDVEEGRGRQAQADDVPRVENDEAFMENDKEMIFGGDDFGPMNADDELLLFNLDPSRIRSSEEPEQARDAPSRAESIRSMEMYRGQSDNIESQHNSLLPWDNAAASSSANEGFAASLGSRRGGSAHRSIEPDIADTNLALRSLSGSRRGSLGSRGPGSPAIPASLADAPLDDFQLSMGDDQEPHVATQATPEVLERNSLNFLAFAKMQQHTQNDALTLDDLVSSVRTPHGVANAFYCCLVLATKDLIRLTQSEPFGTITLELMG